MLRTVRIGALALLLLPQAAAQATATPNTTRWWKGNLHTHTLWSDGNDFPEMVVGWYRDHGYHFLALSDHNILQDHEKWFDNDLVIRRGGRRALARYRERFGTDWVVTREVERKREVDGKPTVERKLQVRLRTLAEFRPLLEEPGEFLLVTGEEISDRFGKLPLHINASNVQELIQPQGGESVREVIRNNLRAIAAQAEASGQPILGHLNHPNFGWAVTAEDLAHVVEEQFFEVFNGHPSVNQLGDAQHASVERLWDIANTIRIAELKAAPLFGLATDDSHNYFGTHGASSGRGWVMVRAEKLAAATLVEAMQRGDFYGSSGVELDDVRFDRDTGQLQLRIAAREGVTFTTRFLGTRRGYDPHTEPVLGEDGKPLAVTQRYSGDVGATLAKVEGLEPSYRLGDDELYVRAVVTASVPADNPAYEGAMQQAWTQPVGWRRWLPQRGTGR